MPISLPKHSEVIPKFWADLKTHTEFKLEKYFVLHSCGFWSCLLVVFWFFSFFFLNLLPGSQKPVIIKLETSFQKRQTTSWEILRESVLSVCLCAYPCAPTDSSWWEQKRSFKCYCCPKWHTVALIQYRSTYTHTYFSFFISPVFYLWHAS